MIQLINELEDFHSKPDPWGYESNSDDNKRLDVLLSEISLFKPKRVLDIGCGQGFVTNKLLGEEIIGVDISQNAINFANKNNHNKNIFYMQSSIFELLEKKIGEFDMIIITGVLYKQYIGESENLIYLIIDKLLNKNGLLIVVHIDEWYNSLFPYFKYKQLYYEYREYTHNLEIYIK
jgi:2-polyprenyl-3-methyl-5-hydroxy-6-metoxy-1,4-benzoquinol methylase